MIARGSSNQKGCTDKDRIKPGDIEDTLEECKAFCKGTIILQYHATGHCDCFKDCDFGRPASDYGSKADVYAHYSGMITKANIIFSFVRIIRI